ncbi:MAG: hypothetical protein WKF89_14210 [Chitinophagaceae bacterium]
MPEIQDQLTTTIIPPLPGETLAPGSFFGQCLFGGARKRNRKTRKEGNARGAKEETRLFFRQMARSFRGRFLR